MTSPLSATAILVVGATGNCGLHAVHSLSQAIATSQVSMPFKSGAAIPRVISLTRNATSKMSKELSQLPHVEIVEKLWTEVDAQWLLDRHIVRVLSIPSLAPSHFTDESRFYVACKNANVEYLVKISTSSAGLVPDTPVDYIRSHWAVEHLLRQPEFASLPSTILRPNLFLPTLYGSFIDAAKAAPTPSDQPLRVLFSKKVPIAAVEPADIGAAAARLLLTADTSVHSGRTFILSGPADVTGEDFVHLLERLLNKKLEVEYDSESLLQEIAAYSAEMGHIARHQFTNYLRKGLSALPSAVRTSRRVENCSRSAFPARLWKTSLRSTWAE